MYKEKQYEVGQFRHERDSRLIGDMMQNEAAEKIFAWAGKEGLEDIYRGMYEMSCVAVTEENFPFRLPSTWNWGDWILSIRFKRMVTQVFPLASTSTRALLFKALSVIDWPST